MRLKVTIVRELKHEDSVLAIAWVRSDEMVSVGDDQKVLKWNLMSNDVQVLMHLPSSFYPTGMQWFPHDSKQQLNDVFILTSTEGKFYICNRNGRIEKVVEAHQGAVLSGRWSHDGSTFATCGEDGAIKMWSRSGMLRSILLENDCPVYGICWNSDDSSIAFCCGQNCFTKVLRLQISVIKWKAHDGIVLCIDWNANANLLVTGGEDCKYKVWDEYGRPMYCSSSQDYPITSVAWNINGDLFAVGSFNLLQLCDKAGWSHSLEKLTAGSIYNINWSADSTQLAAACSDGSVLYAYLVEKRITWRNIEAIQTKRQVIEIHDVLSDVACEKLEIRDRITKMSLGFEQLVVATTKQCYIFSVKNWNTPIIMDLKECNVSMIILCEKYFLLVDGSLMQVYSYEGRLQCMLKLPSINMSGETANEKTAAISNDTLAIRDRMDLKTVHFFETTTGKSAGNGKLTHTNDIIEIAIDQFGSANDRKLAFIDKCLDCFLTVVRTYGVFQKIAKIGTVVTNICFNDQTNMLAGLQDNHLIVWLFPSTVFIDRDLLQKTIFEVDQSDFGKFAYLYNFVADQISVRHSDGALISCTITPFASSLISCIAANKWDQAILLCRHIRENYLWAMIAVMATDAKNFYAAEIAYSALDEVEKVKFLSNLRKKQNKEVKMAMMTAFTRNFKDADAMLVQNGHIFRAIMFNISLFRWQRALELAVKNKIHLETVIGYRQKYLQEIGLAETDQNFLRYQSEVEIDWDHIQQMIHEDEAKNV